jgi:hypothetical protein
MTPRCVILCSTYLGGGEGDADLDLAVVRAVGEDHGVLRRVHVVRAVLRAQADDVRHVDPATRRVIRSSVSAAAVNCSVPAGGAVCWEDDRWLTGQQSSRHSRRLAEEVVAGEVVVVHDPEDELVLRTGRGGVDLELEHLVPARVPPLVCNTYHTREQLSML